MKKSSIGIYGKVRVRAFCAFQEAFLNSLVAAGIELWRVEKDGTNTVSFDVTESSLGKLESLARKHSVELTVTKYRDGKRKLIKRRFRLLPMLLLFAAALLFSSLFVWQIDIYGNHSISRGKLLRTLEDSGLYVGCFWPGLKADDIRSRLMLENEDIAWMTVNISGSRALVLINERADKPEIYDESRAADLVASKTGLVRRVSVLSGNAAVQPGQAVTEGEILASGSLQSIMGKIRTVRSKGSVMADTWYEIDAVCPEEMEIKSGTGLIRHRFALVLGKRRINFYISSGKAIDECDKIINDYNLSIKGHFALPIRFIHETIIPYESSPGPGYDKEAMGRSLCSELESRTEGQLLQRSLTESFARGLYVLTLRAHCVENIAMTQEIES